MALGRLDAREGLKSSLAGRRAERDYSEWREEFYGSPLAFKWPGKTRITEQETECLRAAAPAGRGAGRVAALLMPPGAPSVSPRSDKPWKSSLNALIG